MSPHRRRAVIAALCLGLTSACSLAGDDEPGSPSSDRADPSVVVPREDRPAPPRLRVHVDATGSDVEVAVRTPRAPWQRLRVRIGDAETTVVRRGGLRVSTTPRPSADCAPEVTAPRRSLLSRVTWPRDCLGDAEVLEATVTADDRLTGTASGTAGAPPNLLVFLVDDMRLDELAWMPHVQRLIADEGVTFRNGFAGFPLCCPARASMLTGLLPHNHGVWSHDEPWGFSSFRDSETAPVWLQRAGYRTSYLGKYLNGYGSEPEPGRTTGTSTAYCPPGWDTWRGSIDAGLPQAHPDRGSTYRFFDTTLNDSCEGYLPLEGRYQTTAYGDLTSDEVTRLAARDAPFFSYVSFTAPHIGAPKEPDDPATIKTPARPRRVKGLFDDVIREGPAERWHDPDPGDKPRGVHRPGVDPELEGEILQAARQRAESLHVVDEAVARVVTALEQSGELDDTVVLFTSDNGYFLGEQGIPQGKILPHEPSLRVPLMLRGPGIPRGETRSEPFLSVDHAPTYADLGDADLGIDVDGSSLLDVARLGDPRSDDGWSRVVLTQTRPLETVRQELLADPALLAERPPLRARVTGLRTSRWLYTEWLLEPYQPQDSIQVELYDLWADPEEYHNLGDEPEHADVRRRLHRVLVKARACQGADCRDLALPEDLSAGPGEQAGG